MKTAYYFTLCWLMILASFVFVYAVVALDMIGCKWAAALRTADECKPLEKMHTISENAERKYRAAKLSRN